MMEKGYKTAVVSNDDVDKNLNDGIVKTKEVAVRSFNFPTHGVTVKAASLDEALRKLKEIIKETK